jgi:hypothetical protein
VIVAAYVRVSSKAHHHATEKAAIERAAVTRGDEIGTWYSAKKSAREDLPRLRDVARVRRLYVPRRPLVYRKQTASRTALA